MSSKTVLGKSSFSDHDAEETAKSFKKAMKGLGTDESRIVREITTHNNDQRQLIKQKYKLLYGHTLEEDLKSECSGEFEKALIALLKPRYEYDAECLNQAIKGVGTSTHIVIDVLCTKDGQEEEKLKEAYKALYNKNMEDDIKGEESGPLEKLFRSLASGNRPASASVDVNLAKSEAQELYDAGEGRWGTDESTLVRILVSRSFAQLRATFEEYSKLCGKDIEHSIKSETSGHFEVALIAIVESIRNRGAYFAKRINQCMKGLGTKDDDLVRLLVSRSEVDMGDIKREYKKLFNHSLHDQLKSELSGEYEDLILGLVGKD